MASRFYTNYEVPTDEAERLESVYGLHLLKAASELRLDRYSSLIADIFDLPTVLITFIDGEQQWLKTSEDKKMLNMAKDISFCQQTINHDDVLVVPDTSKDMRFSTDPQVLGPPYIRFYAGIVVHDPHGNALGSLCAIDRVPREFNPRQCQQLRQFADLIENEIRHVYDLDVLRTSIQHSACYDELTKLPNRQLLNVYLNKLTRLSRRDQGKTAVLIFHLPDLYLIKQSFNENVVNTLLKEVGQRLRSCCPDGGTLARVEADEFALAFYTRKSEPNQIDQVVNNARAAMGQPFLSGGDLYLRVRIGGSVYPDDGTSAVGLIERASTAARYTNRDCRDDTRFFCHSESMGVCERLKIESQLRGAIEKAQLHLTYQPIISLQDGTLSSVEALLRWDNPELGRVPPERFIPIAEQTGLIVAIGQWVQQEVFRQLKQWREQGNWDVPIAINVAAVELLQPTYAAKLLEQMKENNVPSALLNIEVTECSQLADSIQADRNIDLLSEASVHINIDDFGTGYSSLAYLRRLPLHKLKIDRSFILGLPQDMREATLTQTILSMATALHLDTVAEGVENQQQLDYLRGSQCDFAQGFFISKPVLPDQIPALKNRKLA